MSPDAGLLDRLRHRLGPGGFIDDPDAMAPFLAEWRGRFRGRSAMVLRPDSTCAVADVVALCRDAQVPLVPQGGNTSLVGGSIPFETGTELVLSLARMNRIREVDADNDSLTVDAGCILKSVQDAAEAVDRRFPLSFGAEGSAMVGGFLSSNAGGILTLRYGNARDLVLGLEVVLPDGRVWDGLRRLRKDNTGYDLKHLFIGAEGTLGVITGAVLKLVPRPRAVETAFLAVPNPAAAVAVLGRLRAACGDAVTAAELMARRCLDFALRHVAGSIDPLAEPHGWYLLVEVSGGSGETVRESLEQALADSLDAGVVSDAVVATNAGQAQSFWFLREAIVEAQKYEGKAIKNDVAVPVAKVPEFLDRATAVVTARIPGVRCVPFGHIGDGNIHFNLNQPEGADGDAFQAQWDTIQELVNDIVLAMNGSISAEHGIGRFKTHELQRIKNPVELDLMRRIKQAFDPDTLMNPGKLLPPG